MSQTIKLNLLIIICQYWLVSWSGSYTTKDTEMHISNDSPKTIFAMVYGDKNNTLKREIGFNVEVNGTGIGFKANKESVWQMANDYGFTKIAPRQSIELNPVADKHTVYVTISTDEGYSCVASPIRENHNVIVNPSLCLQIARKNTIWEYEDNQKPESKSKIDANFNNERELSKLINKELQTKIMDLEKQRVESNNNINDQRTREQDNYYCDSERSFKKNRSRSYEMANSS